MGTPWLWRAIQIWSWVLFLSSLEQNKIKLIVFFQKKIQFVQFLIDILFFLILNILLQKARIKTVYVPWILNECPTFSHSAVAMCFSARVLARSSTPTTASTDTRNFFVVNLATSQCWARNTIEEIFFNINLMGKEEGKRTVLASSRKRADIIYHLKWNFIVL